MKLIPKAKPVKIRISYFGKEHFSLDSLKKSFSCKEIVSILDKPLVKWLNQQNETIVAENVAHLINNRDRITPFSIVTAFFPEYENEEFSDVAICRFWMMNNYEENARLFLEEKPLIPNEITPELRDIIIKLYRNENEAKLEEFGLDKKQIWQENLKLAKTGDKNALNYVKKIVPVEFQYENLDDLDLLFLNKERISETYVVKNICIALDFWRDNGFYKEMEDFIETNKEFFSRSSLLTSYLDSNRYNEIIDVLKEISDETDIQRIKDSCGSREEFYSLFNSRLRHLTRDELLQCVKWTKDCIKNNRLDSRKRVKVTGHFFDELKMIFNIKKDLYDLTYISASYHMIPEENSLYRPYNQVIYNILNTLRGFRVKQYSDLTYSYVYCKQIIHGIPSTAIKTLNIICQSLLFSEKEFSARNNIIYIG